MIMTVKKIINGLEFTKEMFLFDSSTGEEKTKEQLNDLDRTTVDACEGAIELLKQYKAIEDVPYTNIGELISRDKVIDAIDDISVEIDKGYGFQYEKWRKYFCELLGVQESNLINVYGLEEEIRCAMCENPKCTDRGCDGSCEYDERLYDTIIKVLNERIKGLPSAQPERKKGKWIFIHPLQADDEGAYICSNCHRGDWDIKPTDKYCKFCGMAMDIYATLLP